MAIETTTLDAALAAQDTAADAAYIMAQTSSGETVKISKADLASVVAGLSPLNTLEAGVFIMFHINNDDYPQMVRPSEWPTLQSNGEIAEGVVIVEGGKILVVAPTESRLNWSSAVVNAGGTLTIDRMEALNDWAGEENTAAQITHSECNTTDYASGFCAAYERVNANGAGLTAGRWWLPSLAELMMIYANLRKVNYALSLIEGATQIAGNPYWSSTEYSTAGCWFLMFNNGGAYFYNKTTNKHQVRPVSAFLR